MAPLLAAREHLNALLGVVDAAFRDDTPTHNAGKSDLWLQTAEPSNTFVVATSVHDETGLLVSTRSRDAERHPLKAERIDLLYDAVNGELDALVARNAADSTNIALVSVAGCLAMAPANLTSLGMLGAGAEARCHVPVLLAAYPTITDIRVYAPNRERRERYAADMSAALGIAVTSVEAPRDAVDGVDIVAGMTSASEPVFEMDWVKPGALICSIARGQLPAEVVGRTRIFVSTRERFDARRGVRGRDPSIALNDVWSGMEPHGFTLDVMTGAVPAREAPDDVVLFMNQGLDKADAAIIRYAVDWARANGVGTEFAL
jgi:ornithine cyclodeaminase/alanine dehydrogenase-like protein (mu-crystallin family)